MATVELIVPGVALSNWIKSLVPVTPTIGRAAAGSVARQNRRKRPRTRVFILFGERLTSSSLISVSLGRVPIGSCLTSQLARTNPRLRLFPCGKKERCFAGDQPSQGYGSASA